MSQSPPPADGARAGRSKATEDDSSAPVSGPGLPLPATLLLLLGAALRLRHLGAGLVESHSWRQADVAMIAANFEGVGIGLFFPRVDWAGPLHGYVGTELPLVPWLIAGLWALFGEELFLGRLVSVVFGVASLALLYLLATELFPRRVALLALAAAVVSPLHVYYSRTLMPESAMLCATLAALYWFHRWARDGGRWRLGLSMASCSLALLLKLPSAVVGLPVAWLAWRRFGWRFLARRELWLYAAVALLPSLAWYLHAAHLAWANEPYHRFGEENWLWASGLGVLADPWRWRMIAVRTVAFLLGPAGLALALAGAVDLGTRREARLFLFWGGGLAVYAVLGFAGLHHEYYLLPFVPVAAVAAALAAERLLGRLEAHGVTRRAAPALLVVLSLAVALPNLALLETRYDSPLDRRLWEAGRSVATTLPPDALVLAADWSNPVLLYAAGREGWHFPRRDPDDPRPAWTVGELESLRRHGAAFFVAPRLGDLEGPPASSLARLGRRLVPLPLPDELADHPHLERHLDDHYRRLPGSGPAVVYDLRERLR